MLTVQAKTGGLARRLVRHELQCLLFSLNSSCNVLFGRF